MRSPPMRFSSVPWEKMSSSIGWCAKEKSMLARSKADGNPLQCKPSPTRSRRGPNARHYRQRQTWNRLRSLHLSEQIGVSPWYWWADVPVRHQKTLSVRPGIFTQGPPAVKYRGIFLNDEAPALTGWVKEKYGDYDTSFMKKCSNFCCV